MAALVVALGHRSHGPVDVQAHGGQQFPAQERHLRHVDAVGAEQRTPPADGALVQVEEPFLDDVFRQVPGAGDFAQGPADGLEVAPVNRPQELGPEDRHVLGVAGAQEEVALVGAGPAAHADIEKEPQGPEPLQPVFHPLQDDFLPILGQRPIISFHRPGFRVGVVDPFHPLGGGGVTIGARPEVRLDVHPAFLGRLIA